MGKSCVFGDYSLDKQNNSSPFSCHASLHWLLTYSRTLQTRGIVIWYLVGFMGGGNKGPIKRSVGSAEDPSEQGKFVQLSGVGTVEAAC